MTHEDRLTIGAMRIYGGSFISNLSIAALYADDDNLEKIKSTWSAEWEKYSKMSKENE